MNITLMALISNFLLSMAIFTMFWLLFKPSFTFKGRKKPTKYLENRNTSDQKVKAFLGKGVFEYLDKLLTLSAAKISVSFFIFETVGLFVLAFSLTMIYMNLLLFSLLTGILAASIPFFYFSNRKGKKAKDVNHNIKKFIQSCLEAASIYSTQREVVIYGASGCADPLKSIVLKYASFRDVQVHEALYDLSKEIDDDTLKLFALVLRKQFKTGNSLINTIENFNMSISNRNDVHFIRKLALLYANNQFKTMVIFFLLNFAVYKFLIPTALVFFFTPTGTWILLIASLLVFTNLVLLIIENIS